MKLKEHLIQYLSLYVAIAGVILFLIIGYKLKMNLTLMGLILSFIGSITLVFYTLIKLDKPRPYYSPPNKKMGWKAEKFEYQKDLFLKRVKYTKEEINLIISLSLLSLGFLLQILDLYK
jgi:hypothetical protein